MSEPVDVERPTAEACSYLGSRWRVLVRYAELVAAEAELRGLIGPRELPRLWSRHILNSAAAAEFLGEARTVADIGSGAGFPGVVLAVMRPAAEVHLIEPMERRIQWLNDVVAELELDNVLLYRGRAEELHGKMSFERVTSRAVAPLDKLARWCAPLVMREGSLVALKGARARDELARAKSVFRQVGFERSTVRDVVVPMSDQPTRVVLATKR